MCSEEVMEENIAHSGDEDRGSSINHPFQKANMNFFPANIRMQVNFKCFTEHNLYLGHFSHCLIVLTVSELGKSCWRKKFVLSQYPH